MPELPFHSVQTPHHTYSGYGLSPHCVFQRFSEVLPLLKPVHKAGTAEPLVDFNSVVQDSLLREVTYKATCPFCRRVAVFESRRSLATKDLPPVLAVNTSVFNQENIKFWLDAKKRRFLTPSVNLHGQTDGVDDPEAAVYELRVRALPTLAEAPLTKRMGAVDCCTGGHPTSAFPLGRDCERYSCRGVEVFVRDQPPFLVPDSEQDPENISPWFVFNDFAVRNVSEEEALNFPDLWKASPETFYEVTWCHVNRTGTCHPLPGEG